MKLLCLIAALPLALAQDVEFDVDALLSNAMVQMQDLQQNGNGQTGRKGGKGGKGEFIDIEKNVDVFVKKASLDHSKKRVKAKKNIAVVDQKSIDIGHVANIVDTDSFGIKKDKMKLYVDKKDKKDPKVAVMTKEFELEAKKGDYLHDLVEKAQFKVEKDKRFTAFDKEKAFDVDVEKHFKAKKSDYNHGNHIDLEKEQSDILFRVRKTATPDKKELYSKSFEIAGGHKEVDMFDDMIEKESKNIGVTKKALIVNDKKSNLYLKHKGYKGKDLSFEKQGVDIDLSSDVYIKEAKLKLKDLKLLRAFVKSVHPAILKVIVVEQLDEQLSKWM